MIWIILGIVLYVIPTIGVSVMVLMSWSAMKKDPRYTTSMLRTVIVVLFPVLNIVVFVWGGIELCNEPKYMNK